MNGLIARLSVLGAALVLGACASTPTASFFALNPVAAQASATPFPHTLAVGPIDLPEYLERPQIVTRVGDNRLQVDEFNRWGGPLEQEISRVLVQQLADILGSQRVYAYPSRIAADSAYRVAVDVRRFDGEPGGELALDAAWSIIDERTGDVVQTRNASLRDTVPETGYAAYAAGLSRLLGQLGDQLADGLQTLSRR